MYQRDYLMRMIAEAVEALGALLGLRRNKSNAEALRLIDDWFERHLRMRLALVDKLQAEDLVALHTIGGVTDTAALQAAARLLREAADIQEESDGEEAAFDRRVKALCLHVKLAELDPDPALEDQGEAAEALLRKLSPFVLPAEAVRSVARWRERTGRLAEAENGFYELYERGEARADELAAFYERLLRLPDERLEAGGLPRAEIEAEAVRLAGGQARTESMGG